MKTASEYRLLHSPDNGSTASVQLHGALGTLYIQALDAYGFQRELSITAGSASQPCSGYSLKAYMHPGRRDSLELRADQVAEFVARIEDICADANLTALLFNVKENGDGRARCNGFVHLCEAIHRGESFASIMERI
jgi:hypothetical protein